MKDDNGDDAQFSYSSLGTAMIVLIYIAAVIPILIFLIKAFYKNGFKIKNFTKDKNAIIFRRNQQKP